MASSLDQQLGAEHSFLMGFFQPLFQALSDLGIDIGDPDQDVSIGPIDPSDAQGRFLLDPHRPVWKTIEECHPLVGLYAPGLARPANFHVMGVAADSCDTIADAFRLVEQHAALLYQGTGGFALEVHPTRYRMVIDSAQLPPVLIDFILSLASCVYRYLAGENLVLPPHVDGDEDVLLPLDAQLCRPAPRADLLPHYHSVFGERVRFDATTNHLDFPRDVFERPRTAANPTLLAFSQQLLAEAVAKEVEGGFAAKVSRVIQTQLPRGEPRLADVAAELHLSPRSLQRRLEMENVSFGDIRQRTKLNLAILYLEQSTTSMSDIAYLLGFSSHSSFSRAFSMWTGESPSAVRARAHHADPVEPD